MTIRDYVAITKAQEAAVEARSSGAADADDKARAYDDLVRTTAARLKAARGAVDGE